MVVVQHTLILFKCQFPYILIYIERRIDHEDFNTENLYTRFIGFCPFNTSFTKI